MSFNDARTLLVDQIPDVGEQVVVFAWSFPIPNDGFAVAGDLPDDLKEAITAALLDIAEHARGPRDARRLYEIDGLQPGRLRRLRRHPRAAHGAGRPPRVSATSAAQSTSRPVRAGVFESAPARRPSSRRGRHDPIRAGERHLRRRGARAEGRRPRDRRRRVRRRRRALRRGQVDAGAGDQRPRAADVRAPRGQRRRRHRTVAPAACATCAPTSG